MMKIEEPYQSENDFDYQDLDTKDYQDLDQRGQYQDQEQIPYESID